MKRNKYLLLIPLLIVTMTVMALDAQSARRKARDDIAGSATITASNSDNTTTSTVMDKTLIRDAKQVFPDVILGHVIIEAFVAGGGKTVPDGAGELDSGFVTVYTGWQAKVVTLSATTCTSLPCTADVKFYSDIVDTTAGVQYLVGGWMEQIWLDVRASDTSGDGDTLNAAISWNFRFLYQE